MSATLLYHMLGIRGYRLVKQKVVSGEIEFTIECHQLVCPVCGSANVWRKGHKTRSFKSVPIGSEKTKSKKRFYMENGVAHRIESFRTLLDRLASRSRNFCRIDGRVADTEFEMVTIPDGLQGKLLSRVEVLRTRYS